MSVGPRPTRRSALALAAVGVAALTGCDEGSGDPAPTPTGSPDPDSALVDQVVFGLRGAWRIAAAGGFAELAAMHAAHLRALDGRPPRQAPGHASATAVRSLEKKVQADLADAAMAARSGALARLLASMSAAVSQRLVAGLS